MNQMFKNVSSVVFIPFLIVGILSLIMSGVSIFNAFRFQNGAIPIQGVVDYVDSYSDRDGHTRYRTYFTYEYDGNTYRDSEVYHSPLMRKGSTIDLFYNPDMNEVRVGKQSYVSYVMMVVSGIIFIFVGLKPLLTRRSNNKKLKKLKQTGMRLDAIVENIKTDKSVTVNGRHPYRICCKYGDYASGKIYEFVSDDCYGELPSGVQPGSIISVYVNKNDYNDYVVDLDSITNTYTSRIEFT